MTIKMISKQTRHIFFLCLLILFSAYQAHATYQTKEAAAESYISQTKANGSFIPSEAAKTTPLVVSAEDFLREAEAMLFVSSSLNYFNEEGLKVADSFGDQALQTMAFKKEDKQFQWNRWVSENIIRKPSVHTIKQAGKHTLRIRMVIPGVVVQKIVVNNGEKMNTNLGEPESARPDFAEFK